MKDSSTGRGAAHLPYEVYWVKKRSISKLELIDTGQTDARGRMHKDFPIDKDRFEDQMIFVRLLPNREYGQINGTYITQAIEDPMKPVNLNFIVFQYTGLRIQLKSKDSMKRYPTYLLTYNYDGLEYKAYADTGIIKRWEHNVRTAAGLKTQISSFTPLESGVLKRKTDSIICLPGKQNLITIDL